MGKLIYSSKRDFEHISRYAPYRLIVDTSRSLNYFESINKYSYITDINTTYHIVEANQEGRLDIISNIYYGTPAFFWVIADANNIIDPMIVVSGTVLLIPPIEGLYRRGAPLEKA